jgi:phosphoglucosamine mutase
VAAALNVLAVMKREGRSLSELAACFRPFPQVLINVPVREKRPLAQLPQVSAAVAAAEKAMGREGRVLVRASGTENKLRVLVEGPDRKRIQVHADRIAAEIKRALG